MATLPLTAHDWHGQWNYTLRPQPPAPAAVPRYADRTQPDDRAPDWLHHPTLTGMERPAFTALLAMVERYLLDHPPISLHHKGDPSALQEAARCSSTTTSSAGSTPLDNGGRS